MMKHSFFKFALVMSLNLMGSVPLYAKVVEQKNLNFTVQTESLMKGNIDVYVKIAPPRQLLHSHPDIFDLDSLSLLQEQNVTMMLTKAIFVVNKPVGFFDDKQMSEEKYVSHIMGEQKITKISPDTFKVLVPGEFSHSYKMKSFFDADDVSTLPNSKIIRAVSAVKRMDVISQGASTIMISEQTQFTKFSKGAVTVTSYIALKEEKTLVIQYSLRAIKKNFGKEKILRPGVLEEIISTQKLIENYK